LLLIINTVIQAAIITTVYWLSTSACRKQARVAVFILILHVLLWLLWPLQACEQRLQTLASKWPALVSFSFLKKKQAKAARLRVA
jgi:hypothetical protein